MTISPEAGKSYRTREGQMAGPMTHNTNDSLYQWTDGKGGLWTNTGNWYPSGKPSPADLVAEWDQPVEAPTEQDPAVIAARTGAVGKAWMNAPLGGKVPAPAAPPLATSTQIGGEHYVSLPIQPMAYSMANGLNACQHTAIKYITRYRSGKGTPRENIEKAIHTLQLLLELESL